MRGAPTALSVLAVAIAAVMALSAFSSGLAPRSTLRPAAPASGPAPGPATFSGTGLPSLDPDDAKFFGVAGSGLSTLEGVKIVLHVGLPGGTTTFTVGLFDGDVGGSWDDGTTPFSYKLYKDPLKNGTTAKLVDTISSSSAADDNWYDKTYTADGEAKAPSGNYFYRLESTWTSGTPSGSYNNFKVRTSGQISIAAGQDFGFGAGPQDAGPGGDPWVGSGDPNPGEPNDPGANSYDGQFTYYFYVPTKLTSILFRDGDNDRADDTDDPNTPNTDPDGPGPAVPEGVNPGAPADGPSGPCCNVDPSIYYDILDPQSHLFTNNNPSGNTEWENFIIGNSASNPDVTVTYELAAGLWRYAAHGMDAHNLNVLRSTYEIYSTTDVPLTVSPAPSVEPDHTTHSPDNTTVYFSHNVTNEGALDDFDLTAVSNHGWAAAVYADSNGNGVLDPGEPKITTTGPMAPGQVLPIVVELKIPDLTTGATDITTVTASSRTEWAVQDTATDTTITNSSPDAVLKAPGVVPEGTAVTLDASDSSDPDGDPLQFRWDFQGDGVWDTAWSPNATATYTWGDDIIVDPAVEVFDGEFTSNASTEVTVLNVAPSAEVTFDLNGKEGTAGDEGGVSVSLHVTDPGSDEVDYTIDFVGVHTTTGRDCNPVCPDPYPSPEVDPSDFVTGSGPWTYGDNGLFELHIVVTDDDGGVTSIDATVSIENLPPSLTVSPPSLVNADEGSQVTLAASASDPGSDDLTFAWAWQYGPTDVHTFFNDGLGPDPLPSPSGTWPFEASDSSSFTYGDDGTYTVSLTVTDDDGGSIAYTTTVDVLNVAPTVDAGPDQSSLEASALSFTFTFTDPGFDFPPAGTVEDFAATIDWGYGPPEAASVVEVPGSAGVPTTGTVTATHVYGDDGEFTVTVTVCDDDGGCGSDSLTVSVGNVAPILGDVQAYVAGDLTLRVAGEKWHDVRMDLVWNDGVTGTVGVTRYPGSPDDQSATIASVRLQLLGDFRIVVYYTPDDDPVNGQPNGANPVWVIIRTPDGAEVRLHHTFNVRHPATWVWTITDLAPDLVGLPITFNATAGDIGSDDLTFTWDWGDGTPATATTHFNDGVGPDPFPSPEVNPITATDLATHAFAAGAHTITLTVTDDDGGTVSMSLTLSF